MSMNCEICGKESAVMAAFVGVSRPTGTFMCAPCFEREVPRSKLMAGQVVIMKADDEHAKSFQAGCQKECQKRTTA